MKLLLVPIALGLFTSLASACQCIINGEASFLITQQACAGSWLALFCHCRDKAPIAVNEVTWTRVSGHGEIVAGYELSKKTHQEHVISSLAGFSAGPCRNGHRDHQDIGMIDDDHVSYRWINDCCEEGNVVRELNLSYRTTTFFSFPSVSVFLDHSSTIVVLITTAVIRWHRLPFMNVALRGEIPPSVEISQQPLAGKNLVYAIFSQAWHAQIARINCMAVHPRVLFGFTVEAQRS
ncbi:hypothetical protein E6O75_ATG06477 [Venturia nashicola]|uniref:Uncharacterized protein n=1 Tax=Venturia nashicola TaxID=86259 RepID=A0A4Z1NRT7_9PEZI|nr:hypothetical protein E6O75_ATG06477 [Venturia nashicola]